MMRRSLMLVLMIAPLVVPAFAQGSRQTSIARKTTADPNERICENIHLGSRVRMRRFCGTRAEWQALRQADRQDLEKMQRPMQCNALMGKTC